MKEMTIIEKAVFILATNMLDEDLVKLGEELDGGKDDEFLDKINEVIEKRHPEIFNDPSAPTKEKK